MSRAGLLIAIGVALLAAACGFTGDDQLAARELPDVTRFAGDQPVEICEGGARLGQRDRGPLGWCGFDAATARACAVDADCGRREHCTCGACVVAPCDSNEECGAGQLCDFNDGRCDRACATDGDCASDELCLPGRAVCRGRCARDADCQGGERCDVDRGRCETTSCADDATCGGLACGRVRVPAELHEPSVVALADGRLQLWFEERRPSGPVVRVATGTDGVRFAIEGDIVVPGSAPSAFAAAASGGDVDLVWQTAAGLWAARWHDGVLDPPVAVAGPELTAPSHFLDASGQRHLVGVRISDGAVVAADGSFTITAQGLVAPPYVLACSAVGSPFWERDGAIDRLWLSARAVESGPSQQFGELVATPENDSIALLLRDGPALPFAPFPYNPVLARTESITRHPFERAPTTLVRDNVRWIYYERAGLDGLSPENLRVAHSP